jgi:flagellar protein FliS
MNNTPDYRQKQIMTATRMELVLMLYDECIRSLQRAEQAFNEEGPKQVEAVSNAILHAENIITELAVSLDMEKGGDVAHNLHRLYDFMLHHLSRANVRKTRQPIVEVRDMLGELRDAWRQIAEKEPLGEQNPLAHPQASLSVAG